MKDDDKHQGSQLLVKLTLLGKEDVLWGRGRGKEASRVATDPK